MKTIFYFLLFSFVIISEDIRVDINSTKNSRMKILICPLDDCETLQLISSGLSRDFEISRQFDPNIKKLENSHSKKVMKELWDKNIPFVLFLSCSNGSTAKVTLLEHSSNASVEWRLYDTGSCNMVSGKKIPLLKDVNLTAHRISDQLWPLLTGKESSFSCPIVACKKVGSYKYIYSFYLSDFLDKDRKPKLVVNAPTLNIAPRWHPKKPLLYFSQHTPINVRLSSVDQNNEVRIVTNFDGLNMTPAISEEGSIVISLSKNGFGRLCKYFYDDKKKKGIFKSITPGHIHAVSPTFINENEIVFCHIKNRVPCIAKINLDTNKIDYLTNNYSVSPTYCKANNCIAYCKKVNGVSQVFSCNLSTKEHKQLTKNGGDKDECCWSPCGNFMVFSVDENKSSRICVLSLLNNEIVTLSSKNESWSFPTWSPRYLN